MYIFNYHGDCKNPRVTTGVAVQLDFDEARRVCRAIRDANLGRVDDEQRKVLIGMRVEIEKRVNELEDKGEIGQAETVESIL